jgi:hypothetical protein
VDTKGGMFVRFHSLSLEAVPDGRRTSLVRNRPVVAVAGGVVNQRQLVAGEVWRGRRCTIRAARVLPRESPKGRGPFGAFCAMGM